MSIFIQEVLGLLKRNQKKVTLDKTKDWFEFGKLYQSSVLNTGASYNPKMDPFVIKWGDLVCQATEDLTRTLPGEGNLGYIPVYTDPSGFCNWDTLKDSIITQNALNTIITIGGNLVVTGDVAINGCDLTSTCGSFNLLNQPTVITFGSAAASIFIGRADPTSTVTIVGTQDSNACTNGALVVNGGVGIAKNLNVCGNATISGDAAINGGDLTSTATNFNLLHQPSVIGFGYNSTSIFIGGIGATSSVVINGSQESTSCSTGALRVTGGVGIAKNLYVCGASYLNGTVILGDALADEIYLNGTLLDNNSNSPAINQALVGTGTGAATWQNIALVGEVCTVNSIPLWTPNSSTLGCSLIYQNGNNATPATKIFIKGGLASEGSQVTTIYDIALGYGNYAGAENGAAINFRTSALGYDSFAIGHRGIAGGHASFAGGYSSGAGNYGFGIFAATVVSSTTLTILMLSGTVSAGDYIRANNELDPTTRYAILTIAPAGPPQTFTITVASAMSVDASQAFSIEQTVPNLNESTAAIALGYNAACKGDGAFAIGTRAATDIPNQIAIGSSFSTVKLDGTVNDNVPNKLLVIDSSNVVRWRDASTITATITANNGLTMSTATNVQLGGTLLQNTTISGGALTAYNLTLLDGDFILNKGTGTGGARGNLKIDNDRNIFWGGVNHFISGSSITNELNYNVPSTGKHNISSNVQFRNYGSGSKTGTPTYNLSVTSAGDIIETIIPTTPKVFTALLSQSGTGVAPTMIVLYDFSAGAVTFTWSYVSTGLYELTASQPIFLGPKTAFYIIPDVNPGKPYCAAVERVSDTVLQVNSYDMTGVSDNSCFDRATLKIEIY